MTGEAHWLSLGMLLGGGLLIAAYALVTWLSDRRFRAERHHFVCPVVRREVDALLVRDLRHDVFTGVTSCSAFANPKEIRCETKCLDTLNKNVHVAELVRGGAR